MLALNSSACLDYDTPNAQIDYTNSAFSGGGSSSGDSVYWGYSTSSAEYMDAYEEGEYNVLPTTESEIENGVIGKTFQDSKADIISNKLSSTPILFDANTYYTIWIAIPTSVEPTTFEVWKDAEGKTKYDNVEQYFTCYSNATLGFSEANGTCATIGKYKLYYLTQTLYTGQAWVNIVVPSSGASFGDKHASSRILSFLFRNNTSLYQDSDSDGYPDVFTKIIGDSDFRRIETTDCTWNKEVTIKYDDGTTSKFIWGFINSPQQYETFVKFRS